MLIEADPTQLVAAAERLKLSRQQRLTAAADLASVSLPELPPGLEPLVEETLRGAAQDLRRQADDLERHARDLAARALWAILAGYGALRMPSASAIRGLWGLFSNSTKIAEQMRRMGMDNAWALYERDVLPFALAGRTGSPEALRAWLRWQEEVSRTMPYSRLSQVLAGAGKGDEYLRVVSGPLRGARVVIGKATPFVSVAVSADTLIRGSSLPGTRGDIDRYVVAPVALGASSVAGAAALGVIALTPGGQVVVAAVLVGAGAWSLGNLAYDHRKEIARAVSKGGSYVARHPIVVAPLAPALAPVAVGKEIVDHRQAIAHGIVSGGEAAVHGVGAVAGATADGAEAAGNAVAGAPGKLAHAIGGLFG